MTENIYIGDLSICVTKKDIKHVHLSVHPPNGRVTLAIPSATRLDVARAYAISKLGWIREHQLKLKSQARETPRSFIERESHYLWGRRYLLCVIYRNVAPTVSLDHRQIVLIARPGSTQAKRDDIIHEWHKRILHAAVPPIIRKWETKLGVRVSNYFLQRMKTKWGSCNPRAKSIRLNTELVKKPKDLLHYIVCHEAAHLLESTHNGRFTALLDKHYPSWKEARMELNSLPLSAERWKE
ncbi:MAG TPA: SprT family zinc-dependent metalloprotease [Kiritimatiellia bacterium]|nr:SprT family zinc-dependent metalloprotease [Kiritimatiellia bacterium]HSA17499.1 SprT family zinc-dependent metalloprotease [Kiritimatiellia bacterium]